MQLEKESVIYMSKTPTSNITHITIFGNRNSGKSSLFNAVINQDIAIVDDKLGTTTDPVHKRIELIPYGPVLLTDTAGIDDAGSLGQKRIEKTKKMYSRTDFGIVVLDATVDNFDHPCEKELINYEIAYIKAFNKIDLVSKEKLAELKCKFKDALFVSTKDFESVLMFKEELIKCLNVKEDTSIIGKYLTAKDNVVLVIPIDSEAPKGRLILPQVQVIRDLLDYKINAIITNEDGLDDILKTVDNVKMVITDSQVFNKIKDVVPSNIYLTSFSIIFAHYKANLNNFCLELPSKVSKVLICESCTHNVSHEDIGMVKIPKLLKARYGEIEIKHVMGNDFVDNVAEFDLVIHCGSCMLNDSVMKYRINMAKEAGTLFTNYGIYLAYEAGILEKSLAFFRDLKILKTNASKT